MNDEHIIRMITETCKGLSDTSWHVECRYLQGPYNALLQAARANHPSNAFLNALPLVKVDGEAISATEMNILFAQLRIALEALQDSSTALVAATQR